MSGQDDNVPVDAEGQNEKARIAHDNNIPGGHELAYDPPGTDDWAEERKKEREECQEEQNDEDQGGN
uniref:Uncharacterized protein n=1 Tax=Plectus sambesii TaxID=2011161 RepID=A0A914VE65_9BILA